MTHYQWLNHTELFTKAKEQTSTSIKCPKWFLPSYSPVWHTLWKDWFAFVIWLFFFLFHFQPTTNVFLWPFRKSNQSHYLSKYKGQLSSLFTTCLSSTWHLNIFLSEMLLYKIPSTCLLRNHSLTYAVSIGVLVWFHSLLKRALVLLPRTQDSHSYYPLQLSLRPRLYF